SPGHGRPGAGALATRSGRPCPGEASNMSGSLFSAAATFVVGLLLVVILGAGFIWILPIALLAVGPLAAGTLFTRVRNSSIAQDEPAGIPSTQQASYTPTMDPSDRPT
uniref:hypothetical protein n=1 Tax=Aeromonas caviae TaxID=648 RepID=UPI001C5744EE